MADESLGILETTGLTPAIVALDAMEKAASIRLLQAELNDMLGVVLKVVGTSAAVREAIAVGKEIAEFPYNAGGGYEPLEQETFCASR